MNKFRSAYESAWVEDLTLSVGGQAFHASEVVFEFGVYYGSVPVSRTWAGQSAIVVLTLFVLSFICVCANGGFQKSRDLQTGFSRADAAQDALHRAARDLHTVAVHNDQDPATHRLIKSSKEVELAMEDDKINSDIGVHFVCTCPFKCTWY